MRSSLSRAAAAAILLVLLGIAGCTSPGSTAPPAVFPTSSSAAPVSVPPAASTIPDVTPATAARPSPSVTHSSRAKYPATWMLPDRNLSPGAVQPGYGMKDICPRVNPALEAMRPTTAEKAAVYRAYGIFSHPAGKYEIDHIIPIELLGQAGEDLSDPTRNLYPELNDTPDPAMLAKYGLSPAFVHNSKDIEEDVLHEKVCAGTVPLAAAQHAIATDWRKAYATYVGPPPGTAPAVHIVAPPASTRAAPRFSSPASVRTHSAAPAHSAAPVRAACYPKTSGGNCYRAGEFCRSSDHGASGIAGNGERITCALNGTRWRWEPA